MENTIITIHSDTYGTVKYENVGVANYGLLIRNLGVDAYMEWCDTYHPKTFFTSFTYDAISDWESVIYVPVDDINTDWDFYSWKDHPKRKISLPIATERSKVEIWKAELDKRLSKK